jgi:hypothetical protein
MTCNCCSWVNPTYFEQRFYVCDEHWREGGSVFFYVGNEAVRGGAQALLSLLIFCVRWGSMPLAASHDQHGAAVSPLIAPRM